MAEEKKDRSPLAIVSLVLGIITVLLWLGESWLGSPVNPTGMTGFLITIFRFLLNLSLLFPFAGLILGFLARNSKKRTLAIAGMLINLGVILVLCIAIPAMFAQ